MAASQNPSWYITSIIAVACVFLGFLLLGNELSINDNYTLDNKSYAYIEEYQGYIRDTSIDTINKSASTYKEDDILNDGEDEGESIVTDVLASINYFKNRVQRTTGFFKLMFNIPSLFVEALGLDVGPLDIYINILGYGLFIGFIIMLIRLVRGS